jgi:hypothetical protein
MLHTCLYFCFVCYVGFTFARKRKAAEVVGEDEEAHASKRIWNRASPFYLALLCDHLTDGQKDVVLNMDFVSMLDIKAFHPSQSTDSLVCEALRQEIL